MPHRYKPFINVNKERNCTTYLYIYKYEWICNHKTASDKLVFTVNSLKTILNENIGKRVSMLSITRKFLQFYSVMCKRFTIR